MSHYSEIDMMELYYLPDSSPEGVRHVAECHECAVRWAALEAKIAKAAEAHRDRVDALPESFWQRQRLQIDRTIDAQAGARRNRGRLFSIAAAILVAFIAGALMLQRSIGIPSHDPAPVVQTATGTTAATVGDDSLDVLQASDPWESEQLNSYQDVVEWESWIEESGGTS
jgi:hypothetical protein